MRFFQREYEPQLNRIPFPIEIPPVTGLGWRTLFFLPMKMEFDLSFVDNGHFFFLYRLHLSFVHGDCAPASAPPLRGPSGGQVDFRRRELLRLHMGFRDACVDFLLDVFRCETLRKDARSHAEHGFSNGFGTC